jgi:large subunit ribosomal protein L34e
MVKDIRITYNRRHCYRNKSNKAKPVKTPGGKLACHYVAKRAVGARCGDCGVVLPGIKHLRPVAFKNLHQRQKKVARCYGGSRCGQCVKARIVRAFLIEEQKIVKKVLQEKMKKKK